MKVDLESDRAMKLRLLLNHYTYVEFSRSIEFVMKTNAMEVPGTDFVAIQKGIHVCGSRVNGNRLIASWKCENVWCDMRTSAIRIKALTECLEKDVSWANRQTPFAILNWWRLLVDIINIMLFSFTWALMRVRSLLVDRMNISSVWKWGATILNLSTYLSRYLVPLMAHD